MADSDNHDSLDSADTLKRQDSGARDIMPDAEPAPEDAAAEPRSLGDLATMRAEAQRKRFRTGDVLLGRYKITGELGQGGMGVVFRCFDEIGGIDVALKALPPELSHNSVEMEEVRANFALVENLHHPNIAAVKTLEQDPETRDYFLVMECVDGVNLRSWRRRGGAPGMPLAEVLPVLRQVAAALDYAHSRRIIHRDIKPSNIMLCADGTAKVLDFGLAAQLHTSLSRISQVKYGTSGTGPYMAPEQWRGRNQGAPTDQYALAVTVYELLAGRLPFESPDPTVLKQAILDERPIAIEGLDQHVWQALARGMAKDLDERFTSCADFVAALGGEARPARSARRRGRAAVIALLILAALVLGAWRAQVFIARRAERVRLERVIAQAESARAEGRLGQALAVLEPVVLDRDRYTAEDRRLQSLVKQIESMHAEVSEAVQTEAGAAAEQARQAEEKRQAEAAAQRAERVSTLLAEARAHFEAADYVSALETLGRVTGIDDGNTDAAALREQIIAAMKEPETPADTGPAAPEVVPFRLRLKPAGAGLVLSRDGRLVRDAAQVPAAGLDLELEPGSYTLQAAKQGYRPLSQKIEVSAEKPEWSAELVEVTGSLRVESEPGVALRAVSAGGDEFELGTTDAQGRREITFLREGKYELVLSKPDYAEQRVPIEIIDGKPADVKVPMTGLPGRVRVASSKAAEVWEAGKKIGTTNATIADLAAGEHRLEVRLRGYRRESLTVSVPPNGFVPVTAPALVPEAGSIRVSVRLARKFLEPVVLDRERETAETAGSRGLGETAEDRRLQGVVPGRGRLRIDDGDWQAVELPHTEPGLSCERHQVTLEADGFRVDAEGRAVTVADGKTAELVFDLTPVPGTVSIECNAPGAAVFGVQPSGGDPVRLGAAGDRLSLVPLMTHTLTVTAPKHKPATITVRIPRPAADAGTKRVELEKLTGPEPGQAWTVPDLGMEFVWIPAMNCWVGKYEVTNGEYRAFKPDHDSKEYKGHSLNGERQPVVYVNYDDAQQYAKWLTQRERKEGRPPDGLAYRLPTGDEWMTFAQCGDGREYPWGNNWPPRSGQAGNYDDETEFDKYRVDGNYRDGHKVTCDVADSWGNPWGLYGVGGNVWEWTSKTANGQFDALRGASWYFSDLDYLRCVIRGDLYVPSGRLYFVGFRLLLSR